MTLGQCAPEGAVLESAHRFHPAPPGVPPVLDIEPLLTALEGPAPCGADPEYDPAFVALAEAGAGKPENQWRAAQPPEWPDVLERALALAARTRDLRVAVWVLRAAARVQGLAGAAAGLQLVNGLLQRHWEGVHPQLDPGEGHDPTARVSALSALVHPSAGLADLRQAALTDRKGSLTVRDLELAFSRAEPMPGEAAPTPEGARAGLAEAVQQQPALPAAAQAARHAAEAMAACIAERVGAAADIDFAPLTRLLRTVDDALQGVVAAAPEGEAPPNGDLPRTAPRAAAPAGEIASREDAIAALQRVCDWLERHEPSHPAPLLIRRAQRLMSKNFLEIIRDLVPDGLDPIEKLAGIGHE